MLKHELQQYERLECHFSVVQIMAIILVYCFFSLLYIFISKLCDTWD